MLLIHNNPVLLFYFCSKTFPEPLLYNRRTGGLEVVARDVKQKLSAEITAAFNIAKSSHGNSNPVARGRSRSPNSKLQRNSETVKSADVLDTEYAVKVGMITLLIG